MLLEWIVVVVQDLRLLVQHQIYDSLLAVPEVIAPPDVQIPVELITLMDIRTVILLGLETRRRLGGDDLG